MPQLIKILSLDGGGIRGVIPATLLTEIEQRTGRGIGELFDLVAGTSTGGILALGLTKPDEEGRPAFAAYELLELYTSEGGLIFAGSFWHRIFSIDWVADRFVDLDGLFEEKYDEQGLEGVLARRFGDTTLSEAVTEVLVTSYDLQTRTPWFFARHKARADAAYDFPMKFAARATSAAPTFFEPARLDTPTGPEGLVDGGVFANNPTMCAWVEALKLHGPNVETLVVSLGTGQRTKPLPYAKAAGWGLANWAKPILDVVLDGVSDTVDHQMDQLCNRDGGVRRYYRFQTELPDGVGAMDDASPEHVRQLQAAAQSIVREQGDQLDDLCAQLVAFAEVAEEPAS
jgi:patatin-like phospholipase/acyl hydrolase